MKIAVVNLTGGGLSGGYQKYLNELLPILGKHHHVNEIHIFLPPRFVSQLSMAMPGTLCYPCEDTLGGRRHLKRTLTELAPDVIFFPSLRGLDANNISSVYMIRNMEPLAIPINGNCLKEIVKNIGRYFSARQVCGRASRIIAVSQYVKDFLVNRWKLSPSRIGVVYHGVRRVPSASEIVIPQGVNSDWVGHLIFTAGSIRPARGLEDLIRALALLASQGIYRPLVIAGSADGGGLSYRRKMERLAANLGVQEQTVWVGQLTQAEMSWCYDNSEIFVMTSRVEACPNVALEAMSHGALCIAADNPPLPEMFHVAALYYKPHSGEDLANKIKEVMSWDEQTLNSLSQKALKRSSLFSWENTADKTIAQLKLAMNTGIK